MTLNEILLSYQNKVVPPKTETEAMFFKKVEEHHDTDTIALFREAYWFWYRVVYNNDKVVKKPKVLEYFKSLGFTDRNIYFGITLGIISIWKKEHDIWFEINKCEEYLKLFKGHKADTGRVTVQFNIALSSSLPEKVEDYIEKVCAEKKHTGDENVEKSGIDSLF